jgi:hypothetical protein
MTGKYKITHNNEFNLFGYLFGYLFYCIKFMNVKKIKPKVTKIIIVFLKTRSKCIIFID